MEKETHYAKVKWAEKLGVSASGYYTWRQEREERQRAQTALEDRVVALFEEGEGTYGVDRICGILRRAGECRISDPPRTFLLLLQRGRLPGLQELFVPFGAPHVPVARCSIQRRILLIFRPTSP